MTSATQAPVKRSKQSTGTVMLIAAITSIGGFLFGFDNGSISGSIGFISTKFNLNPASMGWVTSCLTVGCIVGVIFAGRLSDLIGRKKVLVIVASLFIIGAVGESVSPNVLFLVISRMLVGIGIGLETTVAPLYIGEIAPARIRGRLVSFNQLFNCIGNLIIFCVSAAVISFHAEQWNVDYSWRVIFMIGVIPSIILIICLRFIPESPRWLVQQGRLDEARVSISRLVSDKDAVDDQLNSINVAIASEEKPKITEIFEPRLRRRLMIVTIVPFFMQFTGITAVFYYAPEIFKKAGFGTNAAVQSTILVGGALVVGTLLSVWIIDKAGRRPLLLFGSIGMTVLLGAISYLFTQTHPNGPALIVLLLTYVVVWGVSFGTVSYVLPGEMFPTRIRGLASSANTLSQWVFTFVITQFFPILVDRFGSTMTFAGLAIFSLLAFFFCMAYVPETKQKPLEQLELELAQK
ncbi:sugar porter family MFS transporter [Bifidobacterium asteroides]|nr:sugar porter family MFS transporter [Bifidobacterium asteroides]MCP8614834.1 sugar porter family MFS transporter [Bifidobacterium asteroides]